jgi:hypothetical protein
MISPSFETSEYLSSVHSLFYASPKFPRLGMKLQKESLARLEKKNVGEVFFRAGVRGSGERIEVLFKRLGAEPYGRLYRLTIDPQLTKQF